MSRPPKLYPKSAIPGFTDNISTLGGVILPFPSFELSSSSGEDKNPHRVFRTKRKHVLKACERCRVKKSKCDGNQPCNRCLTYNHACIFRDRKATQAKVYSRGFVEMLISHHATLVQALQKLYRRCINMEGFPGAPLEESANGHPATHAILSRLGLIKHAEEAIHDPQEILAEISEYLKSVLTAADCMESTESTEPSEPTLSGDPSPEPGTPRDTLEQQLVSPTSENHSMWDLQAIPQSLTGSFPMYDCLEVMPSQQPSISQSMTGISYQEPVLPSHIVENNEPCNSRYSFGDIPCQRNDHSAAFSWPVPYHDAANLLPNNDYRIPVQEQQACPTSHLFHSSDATNPNR